jgi:DNA-binding transcriptional ArsR family regulator
MESALGSTGINATADTTLTMRRKRGTAEATLSVTGRDVEDTAYTMSWDKDICSWAVTNSGTLKPAITEAQRQIIDLLESEARNWTTGEIANNLDKSGQTISEQATKLTALGLIEKPCYGQWRIKGSFGVSDTYRETETPKEEKSPSGAAVIPFPEAIPADLAEGEPEIW